jgi:transposase
MSCRRIHFADWFQFNLDRDRLSAGEVLTAQIFVAVLGASNYTYAEATFTQSLPDWIGSHVRASSFFGGAASTPPDAYLPASPE